MRSSAICWPGRRRGRFTLSLPPSRPKVRATGKRPRERPGGSEVVVMTFDFVTILLCVGVFLLGAVVGTLVTLSLIYPRLGRVFLRVVAAVALALAMALATWPTVSMLRKEPKLRPIILPLPNSSIGEISEAFGWSGA